MITVLSLVTSVKDYIEIAHKFIETQSINSLDTSVIKENTSFLGIQDYTEFGAICTYLVLSIKEFLTRFLSFSWLSQVWNLPLIVPDIASAMISEISVLDGYFTNAFAFLETGTSLADTAKPIISSADKIEPFIFGFEKFITGFINSFFLFLPTSTSHLIILRRFVMQGLEAGYIAGLGTIAGNFLWLTSIIFGWRFIVIPWLSFDIFRYVLGFILLVKYLWDSSKDSNITTPRAVIEEKTKKSIFLLNFLLAFTEQTSIYPFISNLSFGAESSILDSFSGSALPNTLVFVGIHGLYLLGILLGSLSLLNLTVWFWENPAFSIYVWMVSSNRVTTSTYYKVLNFVFLYLTMLCAITSIPYFGFDYTITNPLGLIPQDKIIDLKSLSVDTNNPAPSEKKLLPETAFLSIKPTDQNSRIRDGVHARRERWKERLIKYQAFDASLYDQGVYDILTLEDLNYGFDRFWLRRKMRNHQIRFRLFPGPWMRSLKKQLNKPGFTGPRVEFFRILFEQYYHPSFHATISKSNKNIKKPTSNLQAYSRLKETPNLLPYSINSTSLTDTSKSLLFTTNLFIGGADKVKPYKPKFKFIGAADSLNNLRSWQYSALRKFSRNVKTRINTAAKPQNAIVASQLNRNMTQPIYSKSLKSLFSKISKVSAEPIYKEPTGSALRNISKNLLTIHTPKLEYKAIGNNFVWSAESLQNTQFPNPLSAPPISQFIGRTDTRKAIQDSFKKTNIRQKLSKKERLLLNNKTVLYKNNNLITNQLNSNALPMQPTATAIIQPLNFYLQKEEAFRRKLRYYNTTVVRKLSVGNNAPYFKTMLKKYFYYYKPSLRYKRTMFAAAMRRGLRKKYTLPKKLVYNTSTLINTPIQQEELAISAPPIIGAIDQKNIKISKANQVTATADIHTGLADKKISTTKPNNLSISTKAYSVLGKRASRYRYQIYKDVLQHWYYTPFNRLLLKFDIDSFINRQPKTHFLTKKEERLLHLRRLLLAEHYNTLRWYTSMQHYRTMKSRIGGTKSFSSTVYNQQFQGTFKKIRHLFAITPIQGDMPIFKLDQPLFNEIHSAKPTFKGSALKKSFLRAEPLTTLQTSKDNSSSLTSSSFGVSAPPIYPEPMPKNKLPAYIHVGVGFSSANSPETYEAKKAKLFLQSNLLYKRGEAPWEEPNISQPLDLIEQSMRLTGDYVKTEQQQKNYQIKQYINEKNYSELTKLLAINQNEGPADIIFSEQNSQKLLVKLLKECQRRLNDQTFLKNYINHRLDKREQRFKEAQNEFRKNLASIQTWLSPIEPRSIIKSPTEISLNSKNIRSNNFNANISTPIQDISSIKFLQKNYNIETTGANKALKEVILINNIDNRVSSQKLFIKNQIEPFGIKLRTSQTLNTLDSLNYKYYNKTNKQIQKRTSLDKISAGALKKQKALIQKFLKPFLFMQNQLLAKRNEKNLEWWRKKQRVMKKRRATRKKARFTKIQKKNSSKNQSLFPFLDEKDQAYSISLNVNSLASALPNQNISSEKNISFLRAEPLKVFYTDTRKKIESDTKLASNIEAIDSSTSILKKLFYKKFNKNPKNKGARIRTRNRGFAFVRKPKNNIYFSLAEIRNWQADKQAISSNSSKTNMFTLTDKNKGSARYLFYLSNIDQRILLKDLKNQIVNSAKKSPQELSLGKTLGQKPKNKLINLLVKDSIKNATVKKRSKRSYRKSRKPFSRNHNKYRKRQNHGIIKLRALNKKFKRIQSIQDLQNWWWHTYLPNYIQYSKKQATKVNNNSNNFLRASKKVAIIGGAYNSNLFEPLNTSKIAFKPLSTDKALEISKNLNRFYNLNSANTINLSQDKVPLNPIMPPASLEADKLNLQSILETSASQKTSQASLDAWQKETSSFPKNTLDQIYENLFIIEPTDKSANLPKANTGLKDTANIPFYAGWDESLRKFVVTNRLLSRRDAGYFVNLNPILASIGFKNDDTKNKNQASTKLQLNFNKAPIQGLNEASYLSLQTEMPFNAYTIDQFIPNNQSFYAPLGWKRFQFRHSLLKNWMYSPISKKAYADKMESTNSTIQYANSLSHKVTYKPLLLKNNSITNMDFFNNSATNQQSVKGRENLQAGLKDVQALQNRRIKKRFKLLKQTPIQLMYVPTGALLTEILPSHYISVFDKQTRFPRNRYLKRFLPSSKDIMESILLKKAQPNKSVNGLISQQISANSVSAINTRDTALLQLSNVTLNNTKVSFTLRKRIKPRRKYHQKRFTKKDGLIFPRRRKFGTLLNTSTSEQNKQASLEALSFKLRPSTQIIGIPDKAKKNTSPIGYADKTKKRTPKTNPVRLRQLRRREFQQVYKPLQRFEPRNGGFIWPGDYLRLQLIPMTRLDSLKLRAEPLIAINNAELQKDYLNNSISEKQANLKTGSANTGIPNKITNKIHVQPIGLLPRKYLLQKHNLKVLKKKAFLSQTKI